MSPTTVWNAYRMATDHWAEACLSYPANSMLGEYEIAEQERQMLVRWQRLISRCERRLDAQGAVYRPHHRWLMEVLV